MLLTGGLILLRFGRLTARLAAYRAVYVINWHGHVLYVFAVSLPLAFIAALTLGFVQQAPALVVVSISHSILAALTVASFILVKPVDK